MSSDLTLQELYLSSIPIDIQAQALDRAKSVLGKTDFLGQPLLDNQSLTHDFRRQKHEEGYTAYHPRFEYGITFTNTRRSLHLTVPHDSRSSPVPVRAYTKFQYSAANPTLAPTSMAEQPYTATRHQYQAFTRSAAETPIPDYIAGSVPRSGLFLTPPPTPRAVTMICDSLVSADKHRCSNNNDDDESDNNNESPVAVRYQEAKTIRMVRSMAKPVPAPVRCESHHSTAVSVISADEEGGDDRDNRASR